MIASTQFLSNLVSVVMATAISPFVLLEMPAPDRAKGTLW